MNSYNFNEAVILAKKGDADAFASLYSDVYKELYRVALYSLRNSADAEDAVSETVLDAFVSIKKLRDENAFRAWIMKILSLKIKRRYKQYAENAAPYIESADDRSGDDCEIMDVRREFSLLDDIDRLLLSLSVICGYTSGEIAKQTGLNANTIRSRIMRAKERLKEKLEAPDSY